MACFSEGWSTTELIKKVPLDSQDNTFYFKLHHCLVTARVNDQPVFENAKVPDQRGYSTCDSMLGFGAYGDANKTVIQYRDVQVRRIVDE